MAIVATALRDLGYIYRMRVLSDGHLSWRQSFNVTFLWEFASALTPSVVGGSGIAMFIIGREGLLLGRATAIVLVTALMDELFYVIAGALGLCFRWHRRSVPRSTGPCVLGPSIMVIFWVGYAFILAMVFTVTYSVFFRPRAFKFALLWIFKLPFLVRWRPAVIRVGDDIVTTSVELRGKPKSFLGQSLRGNLHFLGFPLFGDQFHLRCILQRERPSLALCKAIDHVGDLAHKPHTRQQRRCREGGLQWFLPRPLARPWAILVHWL